MPVDLSIIDKLIPLGSLHQKNKKEIAETAQFQKVPAGTLLFNKGDKNNFYIYLQEGVVDILEGDKVITTLESIGSIIPHPIENSNPRQHSAVCKRNSIILKIDSTFVDLMSTWEKTGTFEVEEINFDVEQTKTSIDDIDTTDWMTSLLQLRIFKKLPPDSLQNIYAKFEKIEVKAGSKIISQGEMGDYFYLILKGKCLVIRATSKNPNGVKLGILNPGENFGGDAIISNSPRNSTVVMLNQGSVLKLPKEVFLKSMVEPLTPYITYEQLVALNSKGAVELYDHRNPDEFNQGHIINSVNIPLILVRLKLPSKTLNKTIVSYCDTEYRSKAACYILNEKGFNTFLLKGGIASAPSSAIIK
ncbi:MAG: cyclic nucleotide-binding domain-containing protein [Methylacidiphilales bacterium]|nr:cyclic nucleotide-binding domain-containing protein [Candidatus Methylacidiphilales bacterium]